MTFKMNEGIENPEDYPDIRILLMNTPPNEWKYHVALDPQDIRVTATANESQTVVVTLPDNTVPGEYWIAAVVIGSDGSINPAGT